MAKYIVNVVAGGRMASLLVVLSPSQLCSALLDAIKSRLPTLAPKLSLADTGDNRITLHLDAEDGPMLDLEDLLSDVLTDPKETVYAVVAPQPGVTPSPVLPLLSGVGRQVLRIRVITPETARSCPNFNSIPPLSETVSLNCTLRGLKGLVQQQLGFPADDGTCPELECNCGFARQIDVNAALNTRDTGDHDILRTVVVVHGNNNVAAIPVSDPMLKAMHQAAKDHLSLSMTDKIVNTVGGVEDTSNQTLDAGDKRYLKTPVLAVCSRERHAERQRPNHESLHNSPSQRDRVVDIHTSECPIEITAHNADISLSASGLGDCAINGVLNIFTVQRWTLAQTESVAQGKAGIFKKSEAWEHHVGHTDRGISNLLSTLRVFTDLAAGSNMEPARQDAVLHVIHLLTRFPPAVRAAYILMRGETPRPAERAALAQCIYEVLKTVVPLQIVRSDPKRLLEGSRLLFGLILEKAKNLKISTLNDQSVLPYVGMKVYDVRNMITMDPILSIPMQTKEGLVDLGFYQAFEEGGLLRWTNHNNTLKSSALDTAWSRIATISGGLKAQVVAFNADMINSSSRYVDGGDISKVISSAEYTDLHYLANLCSRNQLTVTPPAELASASPPVLTLDREGSLAVYVGRAGCGAAPGRDILMFRPTSASEEEDVDVSIITGLLEPILTERTADGTIVFEAYGDHHRKMIAPDEITMLCVDLSYSMSERCDFQDVQTNEDTDARIQRNARESAISSSTRTQENPAFHLPDPDELKEYLKAHESFDDFLAIIGTGRDDYHRRQNAEKVLKIVQQLNGQQIAAKRKELEEIRHYGSHYLFRTRADDIDRNLNVLKNRALRLQKHKNLICAWFLTCIGKNTSSSDPLTWRPGDAVPKVYKTAQLVGSGSPTFEIPREFCCHISNEVMEDPVITVDNYTYERRNIERWFQTNETSPFTNLVLPSLDLRSNVQKKEEIVAFLSGSDIRSTYRSLRGTSHTIRVSFKSPLDTWSIVLPRELKLRELWEIAFRLTKGRYTRYELQHKNARLPPSQEPIYAVINAAHDVFITPLESSTTTSSAGLETEDLCLVKVYDSSYTEVVVSYWEPKGTTKSLASAVFRYYRQKFTVRSSTPVESPFEFWTKTSDIGDNHFSGRLINGHWELITNYFNPTDSTGTLQKESFIDKASDDEDSDDEIGYQRPDGNQPLVFKLALGNAARTSQSRHNTLSRLDVLKQMFDSFINRLLAYNFHTHIGLVTFGTKASVSQSITHAVENFRHKVNNMAAAGDTAIWDSIALAQDQLQHYAKKHPKAKLRIICISDGEDNKSKHTAVDLSSRLSRDGIVVDSFCLGDTKNDQLKAVSYLTGGYTFEPKTLEEAMAICEMEPVLSILERPDATRSNEAESDDEDQHYFRTQFQANPTLYNFRDAQREVFVERVTSDYCPDRKEHPELGESFVELGQFANHTSQNRTDNNLRLSRIQSEIRNSGAKIHPQYDIYICEPNMGLWKVVMQGPPESTYAGGTFLLYVEMGESYPMFPPQARFITPIYHPNINRHGRICHSILDRNWTVDISTKDLIDTIYSLLLVPEFSDPINTVVTLNYHWDEVHFKEEAQRHIAKHARKTRAEWRKEIVG